MPGPRIRGSAPGTTSQRAALPILAHAGAPLAARFIVPAWAQPGERYAVIWAQVSSEKAGPQGNVTLVNQVGTRVYLHVGPGAEPPSDFRVGPLRAQTTPGGHRTLTATVANTGQRAHRPGGPAVADRSRQPQRRSLHHRPWHDPGPRRPRARHRSAGARPAGRALKVPPHPPQRPPHPHHDRHSHPRGEARRLRAARLAHPPVHDAAHSRPRRIVSAALPALMLAVRRRRARRSP
jgi:hypothetical protein